MLKRLTRPALLVVALLGGLLTTTTAFGALTASPAGATLCSPQPEDGTWKNINAATTAMTKVIVETCAPVPEPPCDPNAEYCTSSNPVGSYITAFGKCHPTDCAWGRQRAYRQYDGWYRAVYPFGFKTSSVWVKTYSYYGLTYLRVWVNHDFSAADGRTDYVTDEWFLK